MPPHSDLSHCDGLAKSSCSRYFSCTLAGIVAEEEQVGWLVESTRKKGEAVIKMVREQNLSGPG